MQVCEAYDERRGRWTATPGSGLKHHRTRNKSSYNPNERFEAFGSKYGLGLGVKSQERASCFFKDSQNFRDPSISDRGVLNE